jgi:hypothetical protein
MSIEYVPAKIDNFSYREIPEYSFIEIPQYQQMLLFEEITIDGVLILDGEIVILE